MQVHNLIALAPYQKVHVIMPKICKQQSFSVKHVAKLIIRYVKYTAILMDALHLVIVTELYIFNVS